MLILNSLKLREIEEPCKLVGPTIRQSKPYNFTIDGTQVCLKLPRHRTYLKYPVPRNPEAKYRLDGYHLKDAIPSKPGWGCLIFAARGWDFYGPLFTGKLGFITMNAALVSPRYTTSGTSFFHPRFFEQIVGDYLTHFRGDDFSDNGQDWLAPSSWEPITRFESVGAKFNVISTYGAQNYETKLMLPISDCMLLSLSFNISWSYVDLEALPTDRDSIRHHDISAMEQLCNDIMNSLEVRLSDRALAQQKAALEGLDDTSLVKEYLPLKWEGPKELI